MAERIMGVCIGAMFALCIGITVYAGMTPQ
jgi:hypothetical protein